MKNLGWIDSHAHLMSEGLVENFQELKHNAIDAGITKVLIICGNMEEYNNACTQIDPDDKMFDLALGWHPGELDAYHETEFLELMTHLSDPRVVAVGEIGIDTYWDDSQLDQQIELFQRQIQFANAEKLPIIVHVRSGEIDAMKITLEILERECCHAHGVIHCFSDTVENALKTVELGFYIGVGGILTFKNGDSVREILEAVPFDRVLTETDAPYLAPVPKRGKQNQPAYVHYTGEKIGELKKVTPKTVINQVRLNYNKLFTKSI